MRFLFAGVLAAHGVAHIVGFVSLWRLANLRDLPYKTTLFAGRLDIGDLGARLVGVLWLLAAVAFVGAAAAVIAQAEWALRLTALVVVASLLLCAVGWPDSRIGLAVNGALALLLVVTIRLAPAALTS